MLKKILASFLAATMVFSVPVISYGAETVDIECVLDNSSVNVGDVFYADFKITDNPIGYRSMQSYVDFDPTILQALECEVSDIPDDLILYTDSNGINYSIFSFVNVNGRINFVPKEGDKDYLGRADGKTKAGELGRIKLANVLNDNIGGVPVNYTGTGTVLRMKFKAIAEGTSEISMNDVIGGYSDENGNGVLEFSVDNGEVTVVGDGGSGSDSETSTETTTSAGSGNNGSSGGSSGGSSSGGSSGSSATTTTEAAVETTTDVIIGGNDTETDINVISFNDVEEDYWGYEYIIGLATDGIINGYPDGTFKPNDNVKRADFLIMLLRGLGVDTLETPKDNFSDVEAGAYYANACGIAKEMGIAAGNPDGTFAPNSFITRQDMMILAKKAIESKLGSEITGDTAVLDKFSDKADISPYAVESLAAMVEAGIVSGMGEDIAPKANTTRTQSAVIISKIMDNIK